MAGRLKKEDRNKPLQYEDIAKKWMNFVGTRYNEYRKKFLKMVKEKEMPYINIEDTLNDTIIACYYSIGRNGLKDQTEQGMLNYLFRAFKTNLNIISKYEKTRDTNISEEDVSSRYENDDEPTYKKTKEQIYADYQIVYIMDMVEQHFDTISFHCFRLKTMVNKMTYKKLKDITNINDCKKRVVAVNKWVKDNITRKDIYEAFIQDFPDFND